MSDLLDLRGIGQLASSVRWDVLGNDLGDAIGVIHPVEGASISHSTGGTIMRQCRNVVLRADEANDLDMFANRVRPVWVLEDGSEWPLGVFYFADRQERRHSTHSLVPVTLSDGGLVLEDLSFRSYGLGPGGYVGPAMDEVATLAGIDVVERSFTEVRVQEPIAWSIGTAWSKILGDLAQLAGFYPPHFNNLGVLRLRATKQLSQAVPDHTYDLDSVSRVVVGSITESDSQLAMPNAHIVVSTGSMTSEVSAIAYVDWYAPNSPERLGRVKPEVHQVQGVPDTATAQAMADAYAAAQVASFREVTFSSAPDPRHDAYDIVKFDGRIYAETAWELPLQPGGEMTHTISKTGKVWEP